MKKNLANPFTLVITPLYSMSQLTCVFRGSRCRLPFTGMYYHCVCGAVFTRMDGFYADRSTMVRGGRTRKWTDCVHLAETMHRVPTTIELHGNYEGPCNCVKTITP